MRPANPASLRKASPIARIIGHRPRLTLQDAHMADTQNQAQTDEASEARLAELIRLAGEDARRKTQDALSSHFQKIREMVRAAQTLQAKA